MAEIKGAEAAKESENEKLRQEIMELETKLDEEREVCKEAILSELEGMLYFFLYNFENQVITGL